MFNFESFFLGEAYNFLNDSYQYKLDATHGLFFK